MLPAWSGWFQDTIKNPGQAIKNGAKKLGASKKLSEYIGNALDPDPRNSGRLVVNALSDVGIIGDANSCAAFSELSSTVGGAVVAYYTGGTAAGMAKGLGRKVTDKACAEKFGNPNSGVEAEKEALMRNMPAISQQDKDIIMAQIKAGERITELQSQAKIDEAKILAKSALDVETTKQTGQTDRAKIQADMLIKMTEMNNTKDLEIARIKLQEVQVVQQGETDRTKLRTDADVLITKLQTEGRVEEAKIVAESLIRAKEAEAEAQKATSQDAKEAAIKVADIQYQALLQMTQSTNETAIKKAKIEADTKRRELRSNNQNVIVDAVTKIIFAFLDRGIKKQEIESQIEISRIEAKAKVDVATAQPQAQMATAPTSNAERILNSWGWARIACSPGSVFIMGMSPEAVCINPTATFSPGQYTYNPASNQLFPAFSPPVQSAPSQPTYIPDQGGGL